MRAQSSASIVHILLPRKNRLTNLLQDLLGPNNAEQWINEAIIAHLLAKEFNKQTGELVVETRQVPDNLRGFLPSFLESILAQGDLVFVHEKVALTDELSRVDRLLVIRGTGCKKVVFRTEAGQLIKVWPYPPPN